MTLGHEKLDVYRLSIGYVAWVYEKAAKSERRQPTGPGSMATGQPIDTDLDTDFDTEGTKLKRQP
ncbi:MAG: hypothetical protein SWH68_11130 [Thermodesulfobacteriota bacterium]|nr:hypothetical protein [Thermodesulfobacteriota bacterium]